MRPPAAIAVSALVLALAACGTSRGDRTAAGTSTWTPVERVSDAELTAAAAVVGRRLVRLGAAAGTVARVADGGLRTSSPVAPEVREAAGRRGASELWTVTATTVGACAAGTGVPSLPPGRRCYVLGAKVAGVDAVRTAEAQLQPGIGWSVALTIDSGGYAPLRAALGALAGRSVGVVADGHVVAVFDASAVLGLRDRIGPGLTEREARRLAAALLVADSSPVAFRAPDLAPEPGPFVDKDFWLSSLSAHVCGTWLPDAPTTPDASGIHSHGDGFVYAHPAAAAEAEANATLGLFLRHGSWTAGADELALWDGARHRTGETCADGRLGVVRWWVNGAEQRGDPSVHRIGNGEAVTLSFDPAGVDPGPSPAAARLPLPRLTPEA